MVKDSRQVIQSSFEVAVGSDDLKIAVLAARKSRIQLCTAHSNWLQSKFSLNLCEGDRGLIESFAHFFKVHVILDLLDQFFAVGGS